MKRKLRIPAIVIAVIALLCLGMYLKNLHAFRYLTTVTDGNRIMGQAVETIEITHDNKTKLILTDPAEVARFLAFFQDFSYGGFDDSNAAIYSDLNTYGIRPYRADGLWLISNLYLSDHPVLCFVAREDDSSIRYRIKNTAAIMDYLDALFSE